MKVLVVLTGLGLSLLPGLALADCRGEPLDQTAASCLPGMIWDSETGTCVAAPSS